ncbi:hypothetical protein FDUTEX481_07083 [Tolypothrix sp. PCC 7601]|nr:hypothetical protein FDUTEX481_07083 [Tolypothrix sp. PCC 7601]
MLRKIAKLLSKVNSAGSRPEISTQYSKQNLVKSPRHELLTCEC